MSFVGFTGTRNGMTDAQRVRVRELVRNRAVSFAIHGGCRGADYDFHQIVNNTPAITIWVHPTFRPMNWPYEIFGRHAYTDAEMRLFDIVGAWRARGATLVAAPDQDPLRRNLTMVRIIAARHGWWIATPKLNVEELRSGTWHCIRRVRKAKIPLCIVWPNGEVDEQ